MKKTKLLFSAFALLCSVYIHAQVIKGGAFESWNTLNYENPNDWNSSNEESAVKHGIVTATKVTGMVGNAIQLETKVSGGDTLLGFFINSKGDPLSGQGGFPYSQKPDSMTGYYKCNVMSGDTAIFLVIFKKAGIPISVDMHTFTGSVSNFTRFAFKINYSLPLTPDSVIIACASSNGINWVGVQPGSTITIDKMEFVGTGITQNIPQGGFDNWTAVTRHRPNYWSSQGINVTRTTDAYKGDYAVKLTTTDDFGDVQPARITNGMYTNFGQTGGEPYSMTADTFIFYYKYTPQGLDSGECFISFYKNGSVIGGNMMGLPPASNWTEMKYAFSLGQTPDTVQVNFASSTWPYMSSNIGSSLTVDEVQFASARLHTSIKETIQVKAEVYPNPASGNLNVSLGNAQVLGVEIYDLNGRLLSVNSFESPVGVANIDISNLGNGLYFIKAVGSNGLSGQSKFIKQ